MSHFLPPLSFANQAILIVVSLLIVSLGQPAWFWWSGSVAGIVGYALFWRVLLDLPRPKTRFWVSSGWFTAVQLIQLVWVTTHPYYYIYPIYFIFSALFGAQFGLVSLLITPANINSIIRTLAIAGLWTISEWIRLFFFSGLTWNPAGVALVGNLYSLQMASLWGVFGLSFWVIWVNLLALRAWCRWKGKLALPALVWGVAALLPYAFGWAHLKIHEEASAQNNQSLQVVVVQTAFPVEENMSFTNKSLLKFVFDEWRQILQAVAKQSGEAIDLMVLPEYVVPFGTYTFVYPYESVKNTFHAILGPESIKSLPPLELPFAQPMKGSTKPQFLVNNAFWAQGLANYFNSGLIIGLEDADQMESGVRHHYSTALYVQPNQGPEEFSPQRYEKRVLIPLGEYIPFEWCRDFAAEYGIHGSFQPGQHAKVFTAAGVPFGLSICYEETFGDMMRENKHGGAALLVNLTSDVWYPNSLLPRQHFFHGLPRSVENGFPLVRASNVGLSGAVDSFGRIVTLVGEDTLRPEWIFDSKKIQVPIYNYQTIYARFGDNLILGISLLAIFLAWGMSLIKFLFPR